MHALRLIEVLAYLAQNHAGNITAIQFEDGSGNKFNYQINGNATWQFIDLTDKL
jgi:hypothetical protein